MKDAVDKIFEEFETWNGFTLHTISYAGDAYSQKQFDYYSREDADFDECIVFASSFRTANVNRDGFGANQEEQCWWTLVRQKGGGWEMVTYGAA